MRVVHAEFEQDVSGPQERLSERCGHHHRGRDRRPLEMTKIICAAMGITAAGELTYRDANLPMGYDGFDPH